MHDMGLLPSLVRAERTGAHSRLNRDWFTPGRVRDVPRSRCIPLGARHLLEMFSGDRDWASQGA
jgi:hypothetical protein